MKPISRRTLGFAAAGSLGLLATACSGDATTDDAVADEEGGTIEVEDNNGTQEVPVPPQSVVACDNRTFELLDSWGVELAAGAVALMHPEISYTENDAVVDLGLHTEPDLEAVVAVEPDLIVNGQRFEQYHDDFVELAPDAAILELEPRDGEPFDAELKRQVEVLGQVFEKETEAEQLNADFDAVIERVKAAYDPADTVMAVNVSGGDIGYVAPTFGRGLGEVFDVLELTPALEIEGASDDHQGDDISVEEIAASNPDWILVLDRDAAFVDEESQPAEQIIEEAEALQGVTAVQEGQVVYMPDDAYLNEGVVTYTEFFTTFADTLEAQQN